MPVVKFDVSGSDPKAAFAGGGKQPDPGVYTVKIKECKPGFRKGENGQPDKSAPRLEVIAEIIKNKKFNGSLLYDYISFSEASQWKMDQFLQVLGLASTSKRKGSFDTAKVINKQVQVRVVGDTYNGEYRGKLGSYLPGDDVDEPEGDEEDSGEAEQSWAELGEAADADDEEAQDTLTGFAQEAELDPDDYETWTDLATALEEAEGADSEPEPEEGEGDEEDLEALGAAADEEDEDAVARLTELAEEAELDPDDYDTWADLAEALVQANSNEEPGEDEQGEEGEGDEDTPPYTEWALADLKAEVANRGLESGSKKADLIAALEADDEEDPF